MEDWRKDARHEVIIVDLEALVPKRHLLQKIEKVMDYACDAAGPTGKV